MRGVIRLVTAGDSFWLVSGCGVQVFQCECPTEFGWGRNQVTRHSLRAFAKRRLGHPDGIAGQFIPFVQSYWSLIEPRRHRGDRVAAWQ